MTVFNSRKDEIESHEFQMGVARGRLAVAMDILTDGLSLAGQHGVYCRSNRNPSKQANDLQIVMQQIAEAKELIGSVMEELRKSK